MYIVDLEKISPFHLKVILSDNRYFFIPVGYTRRDAYNILREHFNKKRKIKFYKGFQND